RGEDNALLVAHAMAHDGEVRLEIKLENAQRIGNIDRGRCNGDERQNHVAFAHVILDPLLVDGDVALDEVETRMADATFQLVLLEVHAIGLPVSRAQNGLAEMAADEAVNTQNQYLEAHASLSLTPGRRALRDIRKSASDSA